MLQDRAPSVSKTPIWFKYKTKPDLKTFIQTVVK